MIASSERRVRAATLDDAAAINALYNPFIRNSVATFEEEEYDEPTRRRWLAARAQSLRTPVFVSETASGEIAGFANASAFDPREGYRTSVKTSVFVDAAHAGSGLGAALYEALFAALDRADLHRAYALIVAPNPASVALHERFGFRHAATLSEVGRKFDQFHDVMWFEKRL